MYISANWCPSTTLNVRAVSPKVLGYGLEMLCKNLASSTYICGTGVPFGPSQSREA